MVSHVPPFRFGLLLGGEQVTRAELINLARRAEAEGYNIVLGTDHIPRQAHVPLLQAAAEQTRLRIGTLVLNNDFRHPVLLAQEFAALDVLTDGRLEIGLGAGWASNEYGAVGLTFDRPGKRLARLKASMAIIKQALSEGRIQRPADEPYGEIRLDDMPRSIQRPHPPLLIGGGGPRTLAFAGTEAQIVGIDPRAQPSGGQVPGDVTEPIVEEKIGWIREAAGHRAAALEINLIVFDVDPGYRPGTGHTSIRSDVLTFEDIVRSPHYLVGDSEAMIDTLIERRERWGINYLAIKPAHMPVLAPVIARLSGT